MSSVKLTVGLEMLSEVRQYEFDSANGILQKLLGNVLASPEEAKYRRIKTSNAKINALLATRGVRATLIGAGFVEEGAEALSLPMDADLANVHAAVDGLAAQSPSRASADMSSRMADAMRRKQAQEDEENKRKQMRLNIAEDADDRKQPGWKAKAAGVKDGRSITGCSDIGAVDNGGG